jgi:hypothetical protein
MGSRASTARVWSSGCSMAETLAKIFYRQRLVDLSTARKGVERCLLVRLVRGMSSILLGPEIIITPDGVRVVSVDSHRPVNTVRHMRMCVGCGLGCSSGVGLVLVENCTVDASIFVVKLLRAYGGCLGTRSR